MKKSDTFLNKDITPNISAQFLTFNFPHQEPEGYTYEFENFKTNVIAIWLRHLYCYDYNLGKPVRTIWGFYNLKTKSYHSPVNSSTIGNVIQIEDTRNYTSMPINQTPLEVAFI